MALDPRLARRLATIAVVLLVALGTWWQQRGGTASPEAPTPPLRPSPAPPDAPPGTPTAFPGGSLRAHEEAGGHTLERHVARSDEDLLQRLQGEGKREVSTFPDVAAAERAIAEVLRRRRAEVAAWMRGGPQGSQEFSARLEEPVGKVLRSGEQRPRPGRTVVVVLAPSRRFAEGWRIVTAYVRLP